MRMIRNRNSNPELEGFVLTPQRRMIWEEIKKSGRLVDARELYLIVSKQDDSVSLATVYRTLSLFKQLGLIDEHKLGKSRCCYELKQSFEHQHMLCRCCGKVIEFETPLITQMIQNIRTEKGFSIEKIEICIQGTCQTCQGEKKPG